jgi:hypothetical protein
MKRGMGDVVNLTYPNVFKLIGCLLDSFRQLKNDGHSTQNCAQLLPGYLPTLRFGARAFLKKTTFC